MKIGLILVVPTTKLELRDDRKMENFKNVNNIDGTMAVNTTIIIPLPSLFDNEIGAYASD